MKGERLEVVSPVESSEKQDERWQWPVRTRSEAAGREEKKLA